MANQQPTYTLTHRDENGNEVVVCATAEQVERIMVLAEGLLTPVTSTETTMSDAIDNGVADVTITPAAPAHGTVRSDSLSKPVAQNSDDDALEPARRRSADRDPPSWDQVTQPRAEAKRHRLAKNAAEQERDSTLRRPRRPARPAGIVERIAEKPAREPR